ncbi:cytidylate kinase [Alphaproteobacteria bacterium]|nr:cytidylate kinase [Alphaproteobacteria bacterium]
MIIAIDGPAAAGKGTLARRLASRFGLDYLDTGKLYRAAGVALAHFGGDPTSEKDLLQAASLIDFSRLGDPALRTEEAGRLASKVATAPALRKALLTMQQDFAHRAGGAVLDGRDIGTVLCPDADLKLFVTASAAQRALRRFKELLDKGDSAIWERVLEDLRQRDAQDSARAVAPLVAAKDAVLLDTTDLDADQAFHRACAIVDERGLAP